jgi:SNF2 family DNA or RNA helicase
MEVVNTKKFDVVFTFIDHPYFGVIVEANAVQLLENGSPSLTFQRIRQQNTDYYHLDDVQKRAVELIETYEVDSIMNRFYKGSKKIRATEYFLKHYTPEIKKLAREFIELQLVKVLEIVKDYPLYYSGKLGQPTGNHIKFTNEPTSVLFHFRRDEEGMNYFVTLRHQDQKISVFNNEAVMLVSKPAWLLTKDRLLFFNERVDGNKIKPFFTRKFIHVEPNQEAVYMQKFVLPLLENHDVFALGFDIVTEQLNVKPVIRLTKVFERHAQIVLYFKYGDWIFPYHVDKRVNVSLEPVNGSYTFHRIRRSYQIEKENIRTLKEMGLEASQGSLLSLKDDDDSYALIQWLNLNNETLVRKGFTIEQDFSEVNFFLGAIEMKIKVNQSEDWFDLLAVVKFGKFEVPFNRLRNNILNNKREFLLPDGSVAIIPNEWFARFAKILNFSTVNDAALRLKKIHLGLLEDINELLEEELPKNEWKEAINNQGIPDYELPSGFVAELRSYQKDGYNWMRFLLENNLGALLADDMGLGKTIQTLAIIRHFTNLFVAQKESGMVLPSEENLQNLIDGQKQDDDKFWHAPCIVICPKSLLYNWRSEAQKFCPGLRVVMYNGIHRHKAILDFNNTDLIVMSYGTMRNDIEILRKFEYQCIVLDESQAIKNPSSLTARNLLKLKSRNRMALTGTPIENTLLDIWSQMNFLNPGLLGSYTYFEKQFIRPIEKSANPKKAEELKKFIDPFVLRRTKGQVMKELPPKVEKIHFCEMNSQQEELYEKVKSQYRNEILNHVNQVGINKSRLKIFNGLMHLRQLALNPILKDHEYEGSSGKDDEITRMMIRAIDNGHKILLFSQFVGYLKNIGQILKDQNIQYCYLDGSMDEKERADQIDLFQNDDTIRVFLLSLRAGNSGLNLTAADYVFLADPWWNPFTMKQAEDRAHRIGQDKTVMSYKFITKNTIEEKILALQLKKTKLAESIIPDEDTIINNINVEELEDLLT